MNQTSKPPAEKPKKTVAKKAPAKKGASSKEPSATSLLRRAKSRDGNVRSEVAKVVNLPLAAQRILAKDKWAHISMSIAHSPTTDPEVLRELADNWVVEIRIAIAKNPATPPDVLSAMLESRSSKVRVAANANPNLPKQTKVISATKKTPAEQKIASIVAAKHEKDLEQFLSADNARTRATAMLRAFELGLINTDEIRKNLKDGQGTMAINKWLELRSTEYRLPASKLLDLAIGVNADAFICNQLRSGTKFSAKDILRLAQTHSLKATAWYIASKIQPLTVPLLTALADAPSHSSWQWDRGPGNWSATELTPGEIITGDYDSFHPQVVVALHPDTPAEIVEKLRKARSKYVRAAILSRPETTEVHLVKAAKDKDATVRAAVAAHKGTPEGTLNILALDVDEKVRGNVLANPNASPEIRALAKLASSN